MTTELRAGDTVTIRVPESGPVGEVIVMLLGMVPADYVTVRGVRTCPDCHGERRGAWCERCDCTGRAVVDLGGEA